MLVYKKIKIKCFTLERDLNRDLNVLALLRNSFNYERVLFEKKIDEIVYYCNEYTLNVYLVGAIGEKNRWKKVTL